MIRLSVSAASLVSSRHPPPLIFHTMHIYLYIHCIIYSNGRRCEMTLSIFVSIKFFFFKSSSPPPPSQSRHGGVSSPIALSRPRCTLQLVDNFFFSSAIFLRRNLSFGLLRHTYVRWRVYKCQRRVVPRTLFFKVQNVSNPPTTRPSSHEGMC